MSIDPARGIAGLKGALRYVRAYRDQVFVVKLGGDVLNDPGLDWCAEVHANRSSQQASNPELALSSIHCRC